MSTRGLSAPRWRRTIDRETHDGCRGLGALVAEKFAAEGCSIAINYVSNVERAKETAEKLEKEYGVKVVVVQGVRIQDESSWRTDNSTALLRTLEYWRTV